MKKQPRLTDDERQKIHEKYSHHYPELEALDMQIDLALDHDAAMKAGNSGSWNLYVRNWLNREVKNNAPRFIRGTNGHQQKDDSLVGL